MLEHMLTKSGVYTSDEATWAYANRLRVATAGLAHIRSRRDFFPVHLTPRAADGDAQVGPDRHNVFRMLVITMSSYTL